MSDRYNIPPTAAAMIVWPADDDELDVKIIFPEGIKSDGPTSQSLAFVFNLIKLHKSWQDAGAPSEFCVEARDEREWACPECGPVQRTDEDGCCLSCGMDCNPDAPQTS